METTTGEKISGYLPVWAEEDPSRTGVAPDRLAAALADITHEECFGGHLMRVRNGAREPEEESAAFVAHLQCRPFPADGTGASAPRVSIQLADDLWIPDLDPGQLADVAHRLRDFAYLLMGTVVPALIAANVDWDTRHPTAPPHHPNA